MGRRHNRPSDPAAAGRQRQGQHRGQHQAKLTREAETQARIKADDLRPDTWGVATAPLALSANAAVQASRDGRGRVVSAHRADVFEILHGRGGLSEAELAAVRRLETDVGERAGLFRPGVAWVLVDAQGCSEGLTQRMVDAGRRVEAALAAIGARQALLLRALIEPAMTRGIVADWRAVVARETRETNPHVQAAMIRSACDNLALAYQAIDATPRARRRG